MESKITHFSKLAKQHFKRARQRGYFSVIDRYENDLSYQDACDEHGYTQEDLLRFEFEGNPENRRPAVTMPWRQRYDRYANWSYDATGTGQRNRVADPSTLSTGGSDMVPREWVHRPYIYNADERDRLWRVGRWQGWGSSSNSSSWQPRHYEGR